MSETLTEDRWRQECSPTTIAPCTSLSLAVEWQVGSFFPTTFCNGQRWKWHRSADCRSTTCAATDNSKASSEENCNSGSAGIKHIHVLPAGHAADMNSSS